MPKKIRQSAVPTEQPRRRPYTARELARLLGKPEFTIYRLARLGVLPCLRLNRSVMFPVHAIDQLLTQGNGSRGVAGAAK